MDDVLEMRRRAQLVYVRPLPTGVGIECTGTGTRPMSDDPCLAVPAGAEMLLTPSTRAMNTLDELLAEAAAADGMTRIQYRDAIAEHGEAAIRGVEPWLCDDKLAFFAARVIERAATEPDTLALARAALRRGRKGCAESVRDDIDDALVRLDRSARGPSGSARPAAAALPAVLVPAPAALGQLVSEWRAAGSPAQPPIPWPRDVWLADLPEHSVLIRRLPPLLDRAAIRDVCANAAAGAQSAQNAFISVMAWGQGNVGYGRYRTREMLSTPDAPERLLSAVKTLIEDGPLAAYQRLAAKDDCGLHGLGAAFGTKYLFFCQPLLQAPTALILDKLLSDWLLDNAGLDFKSQPWSEPRYAAYLRQMHVWAEELGCTPDELEMCIFRAKADESGGQWSSDPKSARSRPGDSKTRTRTSTPPTRTEVSMVERQFDQAMLDIYELAGRQTGYWANYFLRSVRKDGGLIAARKLLWKEGTSEGFERLKAERRLDLSMEALMLRPVFRELFSAAELTQAEDRLSAHGYRSVSSREEAQ